MKLMSLASQMDQSVAWQLFLAYQQTDRKIPIAFYIVGISRRKAMIEINDQCLRRKHKD